MEFKKCIFAMVGRGGLLRRRQNVTEEVRSRLKNDVNSFFIYYLDALVERARIRGAANIITSILIAIHKVEV